VTPESVGNLQEPLRTRRHRLDAQAAESAPRHLTGVATAALTGCTPRVCLPEFAASRCALSPTVTQHLGR
jgi:hypothetical protein